MLLLAGNVMEPSSIILIFAPILHPAAMRLGIDSVHFGILIDANMEVGLCHPPVGLNLYVASGISKMSITELTVAVLPWLGTMLVFLVIVTYWPALSLVAAEGDGNDVGRLSLYESAWSRPPSRGRFSEARKWIRNSRCECSHLIRTAEVQRVSCSMSPAVFCSRIAANVTIQGPAMIKILATIVM